MTRTCSERVGWDRRPLKSCLSASDTEPCAGLARLQLGLKHFCLYLVHFSDNPRSIFGLCADLGPLLAFVLKCITGQSLSIFGILRYSNIWKGVKEKSGK